MRSRHKTVTERVRRQRQKAQRDERFQIWRARNGFRSEEKARAFWRTIKPQWRRKLGAV